MFLITTITIIIPMIIASDIFIAIVIGIIIVLIIVKLLLLYQYYQCCYDHFFTVIIVNNFTKRNVKLSKANSISSNNYRLINDNCRRHAVNKLSLHETSADKYLPGTYSFIAYLTNIHRQ